MGIHILFIALYATLSQALSAETMCIIFIGHCVLCMLLDLSKKVPLHLLYMYYVGAIIGTLANLTFIYNIHTFGLKENSMYRYVVPQYIDDAIMLWTIGNSCVFLGYTAFRKATFPPISMQMARNAPRNAFYVILLLVFLQLTGNVGFLRLLTGGAFIVISSLSVIGILFYARLWAVENNNTYRNYALVLCALQTWIVLNTSYLRFDLLSPFFSLFAGYFIGKGSLKFIFSYRIIPVIAFLVIFSLFFQRLGGSRAHFITAFSQEATASDTKSFTYDDKEEDKGALFERTANIAQLTNVVRLTERNGLYAGSATAPLLAAFIPRFLWPDKPIIQLGAWFAVEIGVATLDEAGRANNSINMTIPGHLFLDFGWIGLIVGCFLFGGFISALWNASLFNSSAYNLTGTVWGGYLLLYAMLGMGSDLQISVSLISAYLTFFLVKKVIQPMLYRVQPRKLMARMARR
jgi:hypothetical protein